MILYLIIIFDFFVIVSLLIKVSKNKSKAGNVTNTTCGNCINVSAYERLLERRRIVAIMYQTHVDIPNQLYASGRKKTIAEHACRKFYLELKNKLEQI